MEDEQNPSDMVTISKDEYNRLMAVDQWMNCLEEAGIDNAEAYGYAYDVKRQMKAEGRWVDYEGEDD